MKKTKRILALILGLMLVLGLTACANTSKDKVSEEKKSFTIGCMPLNEPAVKSIAEMMKEKGYDVEVKVFDGNNLPAIALSNGEIDSLILNHLPWIKTFNEENNSELVLVEPFKYASLFGMYSSKYDSLEEIPEGATITISNDPSNMERSLKFLEKLDFIKLGEKKGEFYTVLDIKENKKDLKFLEVETTATASSYKDSDATISFTSVMKNAGVDPFSYLEQDDLYVDYPVGFVVNKGNEEAPWAKAVMEVTATKEYSKKFNEAFGGAYVLFTEMEGMKK